MTDKEHIYAACLSRVEQMIQTSTKSLLQAEESALTETKSSAGDKFETSRAMMHAEIHKSKRHLAEAKLLLMDLKSIAFKTDYLEVEKGSYVLTDSSNYFIAIGLGRINTENLCCFAISPASPMAKLLIGKSAGEEINFNGRQFTIQKIC